MIKYLIASSMFVLSARSASAQAWEIVNTAVPSDTVVFVTNDSGFAFMGGQLLRTSDSGKLFSSIAVTGVPRGATLLNDMCWPTSRCGYMAYNVNNTTTLVRTNDAGQSVIQQNLPSSLTVYSISFPTPAIGYATGQNNPPPGYFVAKSMDSGSTWAVVYSPPLRTGEILFKNAMEGIFVEYNNANVPQVYYTFDGMEHEAMSKDAIPFNGSGQQSGFIDWNDDGSWIVQNQGIERSSDSGKKWTLVLPDASPDNYGTIESVCFNGPRGFAFADNSNVFQTTDYGASWQQGPTTLPSATGAGSFCSMPSSDVAYVSGTSSDGSSNVLLKIELPPLRVTESPVAASDFRAVSNGMGIVFTATAFPELRSIEILDVLGRECASLPLAAMSARAELGWSRLRPGSYFARLGNAIVKFALWN